jgi:hypothetical protein
MAAGHDGSIPKATTHEFDRCRTATNRRVFRSIQRQTFPKTRSLPRSQEPLSMAEYITEEPLIREGELVWLYQFNV